MTKPRNRSGLSVATLASANSNQRTQDKRKRDQQQERRGATKASAFLDLMSCARKFVDRQTDATFHELDRAIVQAKELQVF